MSAARVEVHGAEELADRFSHARTAFRAVAPTAMAEATQLLKSSQIKLVPRYENVLNLSIAKRVDVSGDEVIGHVGPNVSGKMPIYTEVVEGGRRVGARVQPFGVNSKLYRWVQFRTGGDIGDARAIAMAISFRGLPSKNNPRTPNGAPVFVKRSLDENFTEVFQILTSTGGRFTYELVRGLHGSP